ncbi:maleylpyruvate isomerase N-terminal domain-containing protein [Micromonospora sp. WMMD882]|uniref:maleylpyruvate isomerase N-terminal domain-containing protein n=1 Tax=Micromonospora sp. WMMD882 TaxID=3015151 RepID=UPI00248AC8C8|nr:maleylpyruvate isomerase N-terminal domain-containing protein [Micromonospora sp. WMMD882]WBB80826.1 maleylpyruvate isomerase N-terminal domain-containing protein [Micromonospora sp. WMMD882]
MSQETVGGQAVRRATAEMLRALEPHTSADWSVPAGSVRWSCRDTAVHVAHDLLAYAGQVAGRPADGYLPLDLTVPGSAGPADVLRVVTACGALLATAVDAAGPDVRAWHWGSCDPEGFAAMGVAEVLLHTFDITAGLGVPWQPPADASAAVVNRLFPDAPAGPPVPVLLWLTGRAPLGDRPRRAAWSWRAALG